MDFREASVQYGDLKGKSAIDGYAGPPLSEIGKIVNMPDSHFPVGLSISAGESLSPSQKYPDDTVSITVAAVEKKTYGENIQAIMDSAKGGVIKAQIFHGEIKLLDLFKYIKRLHITAINSGLADNYIECDKY